MNLKSTFLDALRETLFGRSVPTSTPKKKYEPGKYYDAKGNLSKPLDALSSEPYIGDIMMFAGNFDVAGFTFCDGRLLQIAEYDALFALIGTTYGGDGQNTFAVPDLRGRIPLHQGSSYVIGQTGGTEQVTLTAADIPTIAQSTTQAKVRAVGTATVGVTDGKVETTTTTISSNGTAQAHDNMPPYTTINFLIALQGIFPPRP